VLSAVAVFGAGRLVGARGALLTAPEPGRELRAAIVTKAGEIGVTVRDRVLALPLTPRTKVAERVDA
jgi:gas vesicle protein